MDTKHTGHKYPKLFCHPLFDVPKHFFVRSFRDLKAPFAPLKLQLELLRRPRNSIYKDNETTTVGVSEMEQFLEQSILWYKAEDKTQSFKKFQWYRFGITC